MDTKNFFKHFVDKERIFPSDASPAFQKLGHKNQTLEIETVKATHSLLLYSKGKISNNSWNVILSEPKGNEINLSGDRDNWYVCSNKDKYSYMAAILDAYARRDQPDTEELITRWSAMLEVVAELKGNNLQLTDEQFIQGACHSSAFRSAVFRVCISLYAYAMSRIAPEGDSPIINLIYQESELTPFYDWDYDSNVMGYQLSTNLTKSEHQATLESNIPNGITALLLGPTGTGKTETVKKAAATVGAKLVKIACNPGMDDRQLFGSTVASKNGGFEFIEGPLSEAWRYAMTSLVVLLIDELARMVPEYHAVLIGALDKLSGRDIKARPRFIENAEVKIEDDELYYVLDLPNGQVLIAPVENLSIICTTNLGCDYSQATRKIDAALLGRFEIILELDQMPSQTLTNILWSSAKVPLSVAKVMAKINDYSTTNTAVNGGLLARESNVRVCMNWAKQAQLLVEKEEFSWQKALIESSKIALVPFLSTVLNNGKLDKNAQEKVLEALDLEIIEARL